MAQCTAKSKRSGKQCKNNAVTGYAVCRMHGARGGAPKGSRNARKHGLYSDALEPEEREVYETAKGDDTLDDEIALLKTKIHRMLRIAPDEIEALGKAVDMLRKAILAKNQIDGGDADDDPLKELADVLRESRRRQGDG